ncbi:MAG: MotA/TolQ/ExbB proton channel family protein [Gemmataceae bacterium]
MGELSARLARWRVFVLGLVLIALPAGILLTQTTPVLAQEEEKKEPTAPAKEPPKEAESTERANPISHFFSSLGLVFGIVFACTSIGMVALIIVLAMDLRMGEAVNAAFVDDFTSMVNRRQFKQAYELCKNDNSFLARIMTSGMARLQYGVEDAREAMLSMVDTVKASKENLISYLATIGTLGPLLGLVGTVSGMIGAFRDLGEKAKPDTKALAGNISHALVVTLVGVATAVPAIFFYTFFKSRLAVIGMNTSNLADDLLTQMYHNSKKAPAAAEGRGTSTSVQDRS